MPNINERPVCHRAEDLVTYLYGEASEVEAKDFAGHLQQCDACRSEFGVFQQVHDSILTWRNEALGQSFGPASVSVESTVDSTHFVQHERKLTALAALREFFSVSPLWLRAATGFAALLLCVLGVLTISRLSQRPNQVANNDSQLKYSQQDFDKAVKKGVEDRFAKLNREPAPKASATTVAVKSKEATDRIQLTANQPQPRASHPRGLTGAERVQLAADLHLTPGRDDEEMPFVFPDEPNQ